MAINLTVQLWGMPINLADEIFPSWAQVLVGVLAVGVAYKQLGNLNTSVNDVNTSVNDVNTSVNDVNTSVSNVNTSLDKVLKAESGKYTITMGEGHASRTCTAESIQDSYERDEFNPINVLDSINFTLKIQANKLDKDMLKPLIDATEKILTKLKK